MGNILKILKNKIFKRVLALFIFSGLWFLFFWNNIIVAQNDFVGPPTEQEYLNQQANIDSGDEMLSNMNELFQTVLKILYALLWPVLFIAGIALDNTLVYWSFLHLDASLWSLWNIMKNFANFALWFMVLFTIVRNIFTSPFGGNDKRKPIEIIKKTLIAGVLIQMSWFLMAALIDVSTIMTYSVWWLPMTVLKNNPKYADTPIMWVSANLDTDENNKKMDLQYYSTYGHHKIAPCDVRNSVHGLTGSYIVWPKRIFVENGVLFDTWYCSLWAWPYKFKPITNEEYGSGEIENNTKYKAVVANFFGDLDNSSGQQLAANCNLIPLSTALPENCRETYWALGKEDPFFKDVSEDVQFTVDSLLEKSKWFVWPFITIYSSLLDFTTLADDPDSATDLLASFFLLLIKVAFAVVLFFPLLTLALVLIVRIWILWLAIAISPIIVLLKVFDGVFKLGWESWWWKLFEHFEISNLIKLIFAPVFVVFAISMSLIFLTALNKFQDKWDDGMQTGWDSEQMSELGIEKVDNKYSVWWLIEIDLNNEKINEWMDMFAWLITNLFAVWIIWFFLFFAVRMTKIGDSIWKWFQESIQKLAKNLPIIPIPGMWWIWLAAAGQWLKDLGNKIPNQLQAQQMEELKKNLPWLYGEQATTEDQTEIAQKIAAENKYYEAMQLVSSGKATNMDDAFRQVEMTEEDKKLLPDTYVSNFSEYSQNYSWLKDVISDGNVDNAEAQKYSVWNIQAMINSDAKRENWAGSVLWWAVHTLDWVYVMDNVWWKGDNAYWKLSTQEEYEKHHFGKKLSEIDEKDMSKVQDNAGEYYSKYQETLNEMEEDYNELYNKFEDNTLTKEEKKIYENLEKNKNYFMKKEVKVNSWSENNPNESGTESEPEIGGEEEGEEETETPN